MYLRNQWMQVIRISEKRAAILVAASAIAPIFRQCSVLAEKVALRSSFADRHNAITMPATKMVWPSGERNTA